MVYSQRLWWLPPVIPLLVTNMSVPLTTLLILFFLQFLSSAFPFSGFFFTIIFDYMSWKASLDNLDFQHFRLLDLTAAGDYCKYYGDFP